MNVSHFDEKKRISASPAVVKQCACGNTTYRFHMKKFRRDPHETIYVTNIRGTNAKNMTKLTTIKTKDDS